MPPFSKHVFCPPGTTLLDYYKAQLSIATADVVRTHLGQCDFCRAESQMLCAHPLTADIAAAVSVPPVPLAVMCLAAQLPTQQTQVLSTSRLAA